MGHSQSSKACRAAQKAVPDKPSTASEPSFAEGCAAIESGCGPLSRVVPDKFQRLAMAGHLEVDMEIARGLSLRESLLQGGRLWLTCPVNLDKKSRAELWNRSRPVQQFDLFLSHTWMTPGKWKLLSLLLHSGSHKVLLIWSTAVIAATSLTILGRLPSPWLVEVHAMEFKAICPVGPWIDLASFVATVFGLLVSPYVPNARRQHDICFLDVASIHQTDARPAFGQDFCSLNPKP